MKPQKIISLMNDIKRIKKIEQSHSTAAKMRNRAVPATVTGKDIKKSLYRIIERIQSTKIRYQKKDFEYIGFKEFQDLINTLDAVAQELQFFYDMITGSAQVNKRKGVVSPAEVRDLLLHGTEKNSKH